MSKPRFTFDFATKTASHKDLFVHYTAIEQQVRESLLNVDNIRPDGDFNGLILTNEEFFPIAVHAAKDARQVLLAIADHYSSLAKQIREQAK